MPKALALILLSPLLALLLVPASSLALVKPTSAERRVIRLGATSRPMWVGGCAA